MDNHLLESLGLTKNEISVYLALLRLGETTAGLIVDESHVTRSKIYDLLERLQQKGLVSFIYKKSVRYYHAAPPQTIIHYLERKEQVLHEQKQAVQKILPELLLEQTMNHHKKTAEIYLGMKGMENAFQTVIQLFNKNIPYYSFGAGSGQNISAIQLLFHRLQQARTKKNVSAHIIFNEKSRGLFENQEESKLNHIRYLPETTPAAINIYENYLIIAILTEEPITILINNKEAADSFRSYFALLWKIAKP
ncbi:MAG: helix-turn-helix domain-containing protein [Nanoarchaeota archaeon]|nr:helix-turn-helix domain-containing protein [Nanoarchaeota archaeon]